MRYQCQRCTTELHTMDPEHLCKDIRARLTEYRQHRRSYLLRLIRGKRCPKHGVVYQIVCGMKACGMCWIEQPFVAPRFVGTVEWKPPKFAGYGKKGDLTDGQRSAIIVSQPVGPD